jgi:protein-tyrosine phosphatase
MGNICRSPTAEGVVRRLIEQEAPDLVVSLDSAGTHSYHLGHPPDPRASAAALKRGVDLSTLRARKVVAEDFSRFDLVLAMDRDNLADLQAMADPEVHSRLQLFMSYAGETVAAAEVPDPYYGGPNGFELVLDMVEAAGRGLIEALRRERGSAKVD